MKTCAIKSMDISRIFLPAVASALSLHLKKKKKTLPLSHEVLTARSALAALGRWTEGQLPLKLRLELPAPTLSGSCFI